MIKKIFVGFVVLIGLAFLVLVYIFTHPWIFVAEGKWRDCTSPVAQRVIYAQQLHFVRGCKVESYAVDGGLHLVEIESGRQVDWNLYEGWFGVVRSNAEVLITYESGFPIRLYDPSSIRGDYRDLPRFCRLYPSVWIDEIPNVSRQIALNDDGEPQWLIEFDEYRSRNHEIEGEWACVWSGRIETNLDGTDASSVVTSVTF
jgi:hypothetical protein